uniref:Reverse transcriptase domain-containing protein n=1 Tax=Tanacetum cinerariifolium TaxID=118510 RepID=A0A699H2H9_TANCI|nr:hypothetical protein [Tanacetum cinerariifolium]
MQRTPLCQRLPTKRRRKTLKEAYYMKFGRLFQGGGYRVAALGFYQRNNTNPSYQERRQSMEDTLSLFMSESEKRHEENSNLIKEIQALTDASIRNQGSSIKNLEIQIGQMGKVLQERGFESLPSSTETNSRDQVKTISTTIEADSCPIHRIGSSQYAISTGQNRALMYETRQTTILFLSHLNGYYCEEKMGSYGPKFLEAYSEASQSIPQKEKDTGNKTVKYPKGIAKNILVRIGKFIFPIDFIILDMPEDIKVPLILRKPFLSIARAKIDVYKKKITLRVGEERIVFTSVKPASSLTKRVYILSLRERMELNLEARLIGETLVLNRSLDPFFEDYIELNDLNEPFELRRNQGNDLMPTIEESEVIEEFRTRDDKFDTEINDYPSDCDYDKKIHIDYPNNLKFSYMIGFEFSLANFFPLLYVNVMSKKFHNFIMKDKMEYKGNNVVETLMNIPIFVETFSILTGFAVLEDMDAYHDEGMGDVIFGEPFLREVGINAKRFDGIITILKMRIEQYFLMTDYSLWEVILNGDSPIPIRVIDDVVQPVAPTTVEQRLARKNELKARAIEKRFGGNKETKKMKKTLLKQQYENFNGSSSESLDQIHDRLQKLISQLEILGKDYAQTIKKSVKTGQYRTQD